MQEMCFHHGAISVPSLDEAIAWYRSVLGYEVEKRFDVAPAKAKAAMLRRHDMRVEVFEVQDASALPSDRTVPVLDLKTHGNKHVAYRVPDLDETIRQFEAKSVDIVFVVREKFGKGCFIRDCAGNLIEFVEEDAD
jgi:catechol 2,3-dioxygenase-like lactoylglutathione lyase family enzyme